MKKMTNTFFTLYPNCILVKGALNSVICDLQRQNLYKITSELYSLLIKFNGQNIHTVLKNFSEVESKWIRDTLDQIVERGLALYTDYKIYLPPLSTEFSTSSLITNIIYEHSDDNFFHFNDHVVSFNSLGVSYMELRFYKKTNTEIINEYLEHMNVSKINSVNLVINDISIEDLELLLMKYQRISGVVIHGSSPSKLTESRKMDPMHLEKCVFLERNITNNDCCGQVHESQFISNIKMFTESLKFNNCLNKKMAIMENGDIKNCPSMDDVYGNIKNDTIASALEDSNFKKYWNINKDQIAVCKDCEYRYACGDCRAFTLNKNKRNGELDLSKPLKCKYNPYTGKWADENSVNIK